MSRYFAFLTPAALIWIVLVAFGIEPKDAAEWTVIIIATFAIIAAHMMVVFIYVEAKKSDANLDYVFAGLSALYVFGWIWFLGFPFSLVATVLIPSLVGAFGFVLHKYFLDTWLFPAAAVVAVYGLMLMVAPILLSYQIPILLAVGAVAFWLRKRFS